MRKLPDGTAESEQEKLWSALDEVSEGSPWKEVVKERKRDYVLVHDGLSER